MNNRGFTLVEVMTSSVVFILILSGTMPLVLMSANSGRNSFDMARANEAASMVMDRILGARQVGAKLPGLGGFPADVTLAPETGSQCYFLRSEDSRTPETNNCREMADNALVSRSDIEDRYAVQWVVKREDTLPGAPAIDNVTVTVRWQKGTGRVRHVTGVARVPR